MSAPEPAWPGFLVLPPETRAETPRALRSPAGVGDRLRSAAFAEIQAREAFLWGAERFTDAPPALRDAWRKLAPEEDKHLGWLIRRMAELKLSPAERGVSTRLWRSLTNCATAKDFAFFMAAAEERGRQAGLTFHRALADFDRATAEIFGRIAAEEEAHVALARRFF